MDALNLMDVAIGTAIGLAIAGVVTIVAVVLVDRSERQR